MRIVNENARANAKNEKKIKASIVAKMSKAERKAYYDSFRGSWNGVNPVSRVVPDKKKYDRNRAKSDARRLACA